MICTSLIALFAAFAVACAGRTAPATQAVTTVSWVPFTWESATVGGRFVKRAALLVPVELEGTTGSHFLQLDTGAGWPMWYEVPLRQLNVVATQHDTLPDEVVLRATLGDRVHGYPVTADTFLVRKGYGDSLTSSTESSAESSADSRAKPQGTGTLGVRFFAHRILIIDFPRQRLAILDSAVALPDGLAHRASFVPVTYQYGYVFVPLVINGIVFKDFFYDTGASLFPLTTTAATWHTLTGRTSQEADNVIWRVSSWGSIIDEVGAPALGSMQIGAFRSDHPLVFHQAERSAHPDFFASVPYHVGGTIGNALFYDKDVVIIDLPHRRFGVAEER